MLYENENRFFGHLNLERKATHDFAELNVIKIIEECKAFKWL